jgi:hypothetical protein
VSESLLNAALTGIIANQFPKTNGNDEKKPQVIPKKTSDDLLKIPEITTSPPGQAET